jgi:hypothetical protein
MKFPSGLVVRSQSVPKGFDPLQASEQELVKYGFPPRPKDPRLLSPWEKLMRSLASSTFIESQFFRTHRRHLPVIRSGKDTSKNWSGGVVFLPSSAPAGAKCFIVTGRWTVPTPLPATAGSQIFLCSPWVGIDGDKSGDVLQAGVDCEAQNTSSGIATDILPWFEWFPENEIQITNLPVSAGDLFFCLIVSTSSTGANVILSNMTTNLTTALEVTAPTGTTLVGNCAEWIVELPEAPDVQLANYGSVTFLEAYSGTNLAGSDAVRDPSEGDAVNMIGGDGKVISTGNVGHLQVTCSFV